MLVSPLLPLPLVPVTPVFGYPLTGRRESSKVPQLMIYMRVANMLLCVMLAATAISKLILTGTDVSGAVLACYLL